MASKERAPIPNPPPSGSPRKSEQSERSQQSQSQQSQSQSSKSQQSKKTPAAAAAKSQSPARSVDSREDLPKTIGREGSMLTPNANSGESIAVFTSGGDSQGMNAAVRAVIRVGIYLGCRVYIIREGYQGMVDGGDNIKEVDWNYASGIIQKGGTIIGSARCKEFMNRDGRMKACQNLLKHNITNLVCIGGDGSLSGANQFRQEWPDLVKELIQAKKVPASAQKACPNINIVGMVGSIDNDFCGTDMTIGADTALHRIVECVDCVMATAQSHQRAFIIEVMGRRCGYLGLISAMASEADWVFTPEWPAPLNWTEVLCQRMQKSRESGSRVNIVILSEGAINANGEPITANNVKDVIVKRLNYDTRVTVLGHVQRGGTPSAFDRLIGCRMGAEAVLALMEMKPSTEPCVIGIDGNQMIRVPLMDSVNLTKKVAKALDEKAYDIVPKLRGLSFERNLEMYKILNKIQPGTEKDNLSGGKHFNLAIINVGAPCCGINAAVWSVVRTGLYHQCKVFAVQDSFEGLCAGKFKQLNWKDVTGWVVSGGSKLGTRKEVPRDLKKVAEKLREFAIQGLVIVGGFEAFHSAVILNDAREQHPEFCIPICVLPATISNNVPGTDFSIGSDTALNEICTAIDKIKQSASGTRRRVFIIETMGGHCGYLATLAALASGADNAYIFEEPFSIEDIMEDVEVITHKMTYGLRRYLILRNEKANKNYTTDFISKLFAIVRYEVKYIRPHSTRRFAYAVRPSDGHNYGRPLRRVVDSEDENGPAKGRQGQHERFVDGGRRRRRRTSNVIFARRPFKKTSRFRKSFAEKSVVVETSPFIETFGETTSAN